MKKGVLQACVVISMTFIYTFASASVHISYVKYGDVPTYDTIWAKVIFDNSSAQYINFPKDEYQSRFDHFVSDVWITNKRAVTVTKAAFDSAHNKLIYRLKTLVVNCMPQEIDHFSGFQVNGYFVTTYHMKCSNPPFEDSISRKPFKQAPPKYSISEARIAFQDMIEHHLRIDLFNLLPIKLNIEKLESGPGGKTFIYFNELPYNLGKYNQHDLYFYKSSEFRYTGNHADLDKALGNRMYGIKYDKKAGTNFTKILKSDATDFNIFIGKEEELLAVIQRKYFF